LEYCETHELDLIISKLVTKIKVAVMVGIKDEPKATLDFLNQEFQLNIQELLLQE